MTKESKGQNESYGVQITCSICGQIGNTDYSNHCTTCFSLLDKDPVQILDSVDDLTKENHKRLIEYDSLN